MVFALLGGAASLCASADGPTSPLVQAHEIQQAVRAVGKEKLPAIVAIRSTRRIPAPQQPDGASAGGEQVVAINGAGTIIRAEGLIVTNEHVVRGASDIQVTLNDGRRQRAELVATDARGDLAVIKIEQKNLPTIDLCNWASVGLGDWVVAIGNPLGVANDGGLSVSVGVLSNFNRRLPALGAEDDRLYHDLLQFTAPIHPGNSGGPLLNLDGELVGIVTAMHIRTADDDPLAFALPMTPQRRATIDRLCCGSSIEYGYVGLRVRANDGGSSATDGVIVDDIDPQGSARRLGLISGDVLMRCEGRPIPSPSEFAALIGATPVGRSLKLEFLHDGQMHQIELPVERREPSSVARVKNGSKPVATAVEVR